MPSVPPPPPMPIASTAGSFQRNSIDQNNNNKLDLRECLWAVGDPEVQRACYFARTCCHSSPKECVYSRFEPRLQTGTMRKQCKFHQKLIENIFRSNLWIVRAVDAFRRSAGCWWSADKCHQTLLHEQRRDVQCPVAAGGAERKYAILQPESWQSPRLHLRRSSRLGLHQGEAEATLRSAGALRCRPQPLAKQRERSQGALDAHLRISHWRRQWCKCNLEVSTKQSLNLDANDHFRYFLLRNF